MKLLIHLFPSRYQQLLLHKKLACCDKTTRSKLQRNKEKWIYTSKRYTARPQWARSGKVSRPVYTYGVSWELLSLTLTDPLQDEHYKVWTKFKTCQTENLNPYISPSNAMNWQASIGKLAPLCTNMNVFIHKVHLINETHHFDISRLALLCWIISLAGLLIPNLMQP